MAVEIRTLKNDDANDEQVLVCSTTGAVFGFIFAAEWDVVQQFLEWLPEDARHFDNDDLGVKWHEFQDAYACHECGEKGNVQCSGLVFNQCCRNFFCTQHEGDDVWSDPTHPDGEKTFGHECKG